MALRLKSGTTSRDAHDALRDVEFRATNVDSRCPMPFRLQVPNQESDVSGPDRARENVDPQVPRPGGRRRLAEGVR
jgi:hypothetical protein